MKNLLDEKFRCMDLLFERRKDAKFFNQALSLLADCKKVINVYETYNVLVSDVTERYNIALEGATIVSKAEEDYQASGSRMVLTNEGAVLKGIAIPGARAICKTNNKNKVILMKNILIMYESDNPQDNIDLAVKLSSMTPTKAWKFYNQIMPTDKGLNNVKK